ncbi:uncharacterized protein LOC100823333 [Brachypodium distachyon]|uniref:DUF569 domain-containing protein n=1 Tax=Brachypodium distachyon TaxID=15368 RepID=A0A2K2DQB7_BRADI|nr:uncharacterized protein LOC100823333 [Brachypodium distachyon]PNT76472.1 hypothetical protein BRADI_1g48565v3 [Brachypodium distachyon]|eukprot:XP_024313361.1 uncharacterized protein LOC100823333 [Brachypodium distachyon]
MDRFPDRRHVRLRSREQGWYLHATSDGMDVCLNRDRRSVNAAWAVHLDNGRDGVRLLLHSAAYGRYLAATNKKAPRGHRGFSTKLLECYDFEGDESVRWEAVMSGSKEDVQLRHVEADGKFRYLRGSGKYRYWKDKVTVHRKNRSTMTHWVVELIPLSQGFPGIPGPFDEPVPSNFGLMLGRELPPWRLIKYVRAAEDGSYNQQANAWTTIQFRGNSVGTLRNELASRTGITDVDFVMCIQAGRQGRLTPVLVNMPREGHGDTVYIVIIVSGTPGEAALRYPDINA